MPFVDAVPIEPRVKGPTIRAQAVIAQNGVRKVVFYLNAAALKVLFGGAVQGDKFRVQFGTDEDLGTALIIATSNGPCSLAVFGKHETGMLTVVAPRHVRETTQSVPCRVVMNAEGGVVVDVPWIQRVKAVQK